MFLVEVVPNFTVVDFLEGGLARCLKPIFLVGVREDEDQFGELGGDGGVGSRLC